MYTTYSAHGGHGIWLHLSDRVIEHFGDIDVLLDAFS